MKILLISPLDPVVPDKRNLKWLSGGESTYTKSLLENPPKGIEYVHVTDALKRGLVEFGKWQEILVWLMKFRILPIGPRVYDIKIKTRFDLIHSHVHPVRCNENIPLICSDSSSNYLTLKYYFGWADWRIGMGEKIKGWVWKKLNVNEGNNLIVWSKFAKKMQGKGEVIFPGIKDIYTQKIKHTGVNILFVGTWFARKGGFELVRAFGKLKEKYVDINLIVVGEVDLPGIETYKWLPREKLMDLYANADIFVNIPPKMEGFGIAVLEAMAWGIPVIATKVGALPEMVVNKKTGIISNDVYHSLDWLIRNRKKRLEMGRMARKRFVKLFDVKVTNRLLRMTYDKCTARKV
jgi:glycosyltransferase involved in cell wall biosynthesis